MRDDQEHVVQVEAAEKVTGGTLFYPYCYRNHMEVLLLFMDILSELYLVDPQYDLGSGTNRHLDTIFEPRGVYRLQDVKWFGTEEARDRWVHDPERRGARYRAVAPYGKTEVYVNEDTGRTLTIHQVRAHPKEIFHQIPKIDVFCYIYNGNKNNRYIKLGGEWLLTEHEVPTGRIGYLDLVLDRMPSGGLIVTDGMHRAYADGGPYAELRKTYEKFTSVSRQRAFSEARSFTDALGRTFRCVGYLVNVNMGPRSSGT